MLSSTSLLCDLLARDAPRRASLLADARSLPALRLNARQLCDLELILCGAFSPLTGFLARNDYVSVLDRMRLADGALWPIPITLDLPSSLITDLAIVIGSRVVLRDHNDNRPLAILTISDIYRPDKAREAIAVFGKNDSSHPAVHYLHNIAGDVYVGGPLEAIAPPAHYDFVEHRFTPAELREWFHKLNWTRIVAFQTRNPMHRAHRELTVRAARAHKCNILIHPVVGATKPGDIDHYTRVKVYKALLPKYPQGMAMLSLLPLAMRMGGPREALWHAIIRKNYGCTHFIIGRDHAGPGKDASGADFYGPYDAQTLVEQYKSELGIEVVPFQMVSYLPDTDVYVPADEVPAGVKTLNLSGTELRRRLKTGAQIPNWFTYPEVQAILRSVHPPRSRQGFAVVVVSASDHYRRTIGRVLESVLNQTTQRSISLLDDNGVLSPHASAVSPDHHADHDTLAYERIGFVAGEISSAGGVAIVAINLPTDTSRHMVKSCIERRGGGVITAFLTDTDDHADPTHHDIESTLSPSPALNDADHHPSSSTIFDLPKLSTMDVVTSARSSITQAVHDIILELEREGYIGES